MLVAGSRSISGSTTQRRSVLFSAALSGSLASRLGSLAADSTSSHLSRDRRWGSFTLSAGSVCFLLTGLAIAPVISRPP